MRTHRSLFIHILLAASTWMAVLILVQGCSIWEPVPLGRAHSQIEVGDTVRVTREDGFRKSFKVVGPIEDGIIRGERDSVSLE